jgi:cytochrome P450
VLELIAERRRNPSDDLLTALVEAEEGGDRLDSGELVAMVVQLLFAGHETTRNLIASGLYTLLDHPDQLARVRSDRSLLPSAVDEVLRYEPPITFTSRIARQRLEIAGVDVPAGQFVVLNLTAANRDPRRFHDPDRFDVGRHDNRHLSFGFGIHYCLGANLARMEGEVVLATLLDRFAEIEVIADGSDWMAWTPLRTRERLTVRVQPK